MIESAVVPEGKRELRLLDSEQPGLVARVHVGGRASYWLHAGGGRRGRKIRLRIGEHGKPWTPDGRHSARAEARRLLGLLASGRDVAGERAQARTIPTLAEFGVLYVREHAIPRKRLTSVAADIGNLSRILFDDEDRRDAWRRALWREAREARPDDGGLLPQADPAARLIGGDAGLSTLGRTRIDRVSHAAVDALHRELRATPTAANRAVALLSHLFTITERRGLRPAGSNPARGVERYRERKRARLLSPDELTRLGAALATTTEGLYQVAAVRLLLFTGARRSEVLTAKWEHVDLDYGTLRVPVTKEGEPKLIRLNPPALRILAALPRESGNPYVLPGRRHGQHLYDVEHPWQRIARAAGLADVRLHDLRHAFASVAAAGGASLPIIGALLGHRVPATTQRYAHLGADPLRATAERVGADLERALAAPSAPRLAVPVKRRA